MNYLIRLFLAGALLAGGCATNDVLNKTHSHYEPNKNRQESDVEVAGSSGYYALLLLAIPFDIVTSPVQVGIFLIEGPGVKAIPSKPNVPPSSPKGGRPSSTPAPKAAMSSARGGGAVGLAER